MFPFDPWAVLIAAVSSFALGGLWFSPLLFGKIQEREMRKRGETAPLATPPVFAISFALTVIEAFALAWLLGDAPGLPRSLGAGFLVGACFAATGTGINYLYTGRGLRLWLVDGGFHVARFATYGLVLGMWG
jgi:hypothetical protein